MIAEPHKSHTNIPEDGVQYIGIVQCGGILDLRASASKHIRCLNDSTHLYFKCPTASGGYRFHPYARSIGFSTISLLHILPLGPYTSCCLQQVLVLIYAVSAAINFLLTSWQIHNMALNIHRGMVQFETPPIKTQ